MTKIYRVLTFDPYLGVSFILCCFALMDSIKSDLPGWAVFFGLALAYYIFKLALSSSAYDELRRESKL